MRSMFFLAALPVALLVGCASPETKPAAPKAAETKPAEAKPAEAKKAPQCWSSDHNKFFDIGEKAEISGVKVECKATSDGKNAQWMGSKH